jgi:hypothetical protein
MGKKKPFRWSFGALKTIKNQLLSDSEDEQINFEKFEESDSDHNDIIENSQNIQTINRLPALINETKENQADGQIIICQSNEHETAYSQLQVTRDLLKSKQNEKMAKLTKENVLDETELKFPVEFSREYSEEMLFRKRNSDETHQVNTGDVAEQFPFEENLHNPAIKELLNEIPPEDGISHNNIPTTRFILPSTLTKLPTRDNIVEQVNEN